MQFEIVEENGNVHGPFATVQDALVYAEDRGLGEQADPNDARRAGWYFRRAKPTLPTD